jgi:hypothetical protein
MLAGYRTSRSRRVLESVGGNTAAASTGQSGPSLGYESLEDFVTDNYVTAYNWHGTCRMAPVDKVSTPRSSTTTTNHHTSRARNFKS